MTTTTNLPLLALFPPATKSLRHAALLLVLLLGVVGKIEAQQYVVSKLPTQSRLPVASVHCIMQDSEGFMWYGTNGGGLCRDNGYQIDVWRNGTQQSRRINSNEVTCMAEGTHGKIWFGTGKGLYCMDKAHYSLSQPVRKLADKRIDAIYLDRRGRVWLSSNSDIVCCNAQGEIMSSCKAGGFVSQFFDDGNRLWATVWCGGMLALNKQDYQAGRCHFRSQPWPLDRWPMHMVKAHEPDCYWVSTWGHGIGYYEPKANRLTLQPATQGSEEKRQVIDMHMDSSQGILWTTTMNNIYAYTIHGKSLQPMPTDKFITKGNKILDHMAEDRKGNLYVAGFTPHTFIISTDNNQIKSHTVQPMRKLTGFPLLADRVVPDGDGFWIWQGRMGLTHYDPSAERIMPVTTHVFERSIVQRKDHGGLWAVAGRQLFLLSATAKGVQEQLVATTKENITALYDKGDGHVWIGTSKAMYSYTTISQQLKKVGDVEGKVTGVTVTDNQTVYFIIEGNGLWKQEGSAKPFRLYGGAEEFTALAMLNGTTLVAATAQGSVYVLSEGDRKLKKDMDMSLANGDLIKDIETDRMGHVWLLADQYTIEHNPQNHAFRIFRNTNPFINVSYFYSLAPTANGMLLNGAGAFCEVSSSQALNRSTGQGAKPIVTSVAIGDSICLIGQVQKTLRLPKGRQTLTVMLSTLDVLHASETSYAYRLKGQNSEWVYLPQGTNTITMADLPKGTYQLEVKATDANGCWGEPWQCLTIVRPPYWYETWWAWLLYVALAVGFVFGLWHLNRRIHWLETLQRKREELSLSEINLQPEDTNKGKLDEQFLRQAILSVESHLDDTGFSVERFADEMCMSRMNLYRKMQGQTGQTPSEFMRDIRLKKAAQLILNGPKMPIAEVAERVGFASSGYFSKCFRQKFGVLPTEYAKGNNEKVDAER